MSQPALRPFPSGSDVPLLTGAAVCPVCLRQFKSRNDCGVLPCFAAQKFCKGCLDAVAPRPRENCAFCNQPHRRPPSEKPVVVITAAVPPASPPASLPLPLPAPSLPPPPLKPPTLGDTANGALGNRMDKPRRNVCDWPGCSKAFAKPSALQRHSRVHTGSRPFTCYYPGCVFASAERGNLKRHTKVHTGEKPYVCAQPGCGREFAREEHRAQHAFRCHKDAILQDRKRKRDEAALHAVARIRTLSQPPPPTAADNPLRNAEPVAGMLYLRPVASGGALSSSVVSSSSSPTAAITSATAASQSSDSPPKVGTPNTTAAPATASAPVSNRLSSTMSIAVPHTFSSVNSGTLPAWLASIVPAVSNRVDAGTSPRPMPTMNSNMPRSPGVIQVP